MKIKTKYTLMSNGTTNVHIKKNLIIGPYKFEQVEDFKYSGVNSDHKNHMKSSLESTRRIKHIFH